MVEVGSMYGAGSSLQPKHRKACDWVVSLVTERDEENDNPPFLQDDVKVLRLSSTFREISDPLVASGSCLLANIDEKNEIPWQGQRLGEFMARVNTELMELREFGLSKFTVCFEAYKLLETNFTELLRQYGQMKMYENCIHALRPCMDLAAQYHQFSRTKNVVWVEEIGFGVFAEGIRMLWDYEVEGEVQERLEKVKVLALNLFSDVIEEGLDALEERQSGTEDVLSAREIGAIRFLKDPKHLVESAREWAIFARMRVDRNSTGHPFSSASTWRVRKYALQMYNDLLVEDFSKEFRNVALIGAVNLRITRNLAKEEKYQLMPGVIEDCLAALKI